MNSKDSKGLAARAVGTAFAILYAPRAVPDSAKPPKKTGPKARLSKVQQSAIALETPAERRARQLLGNSAPNFNVPIATQADSLRTAAIKGRT
jgi:hypothetical protein